MPAKQLDAPCWQPRRPGELPRDARHWLTRERAAEYAGPGETPQPFPQPCWTAICDGLPGVPCGEELEDAEEGWTIHAVSAADLANFAETEGWQVGPDGTYRCLRCIDETIDATDGWAVIAPDGTLTWHPVSATADVERLVSGDYAPGALDRAFVAGPIRLLASDIALAVPEHYPPNPVAREVLAMLSGGRITQPWRGHVALTQYERDEKTGEWLWPGPVGAQWAARINDIVKAVQEGTNGS